MLSSKDGNILYFRPERNRKGVKGGKKEARISVPLISVQSFVHLHFHSSDEES